MKKGTAVDFEPKIRTVPLKMGQLECLEVCPPYVGVHTPMQVYSLLSIHRCKYTHYCICRKQVRHYDKTDFDHSSHSRLHLEVHICFLCRMDPTVL